METMRLQMGAKLVVSTEDGDQDDEVVRVVEARPQAGVWVVETARNGRVVVMGATEVDGRPRARLAGPAYGDIPGS